MATDLYLSHIGLECEDLSVMERFYRRVVGLSVAESAPELRRLNLGAGDPVLELTAGTPGVTHIAFEAADEGAQLEERLAAAGLETRWMEGDERHPRSLVFADPDGHRIEVHGPIDRRGEGAGARGNRPVRLHHVTFASPDVPAMVAFYADVLGFRVSDRMADKFVWLRCNAEHHTVAVVTGDAPALDHYCYEVADWDDIKAWCDGLASRGVPVTWGPGRHGPGNNLFIMFDDPAGNRIELSCELERFWDDRVTYPAPREWAESTLSVNLWGPAPDWRRPLEAPAAGP